MLFHSFAFFAFFWIVFAIYWALPTLRLRNGWLVIASCVFYGTWNPSLTLLILFTASVDYVIALRLMKTESPSARRTLLTASIVASLTPLIFFKYSRFLADTATDGLNLLGANLSSPVFQIVLPLGISFYTFETISYVVDVYRRRVPAARSIQEYALYILFFPHLIAGPIVRPGFFLPQTQREKRFDWARLQLGARIFLRGLFKKAVLADHLAPIVDPIFGSPEGYSTGALWLAVPCYAVQVYFDFSGYSDMAVGAAHAFGFKLPLNFNLPYFAASIGEFWRRWHITLSTWLRDYLYIPLGGSRAGPVRTCLHLILTLVICGVWHGAGWTYIVFGLYHGVLLVLERTLPRPAWLRLPGVRPMRIAFTFVLLCIGLVVFRSENLAAAGTMLKLIFTGAAGQSLDPRQVWTAGIVLFAAFAGHFAGTFLDTNRSLRRVPPIAAGIGLAAWFLLIQLLTPRDGAPFVYFQF